jgi:hypothetical protein
LRTAIVALDFAASVRRSGLTLKPVTAAARGANSAAAASAAAAARLTARSP